MITIVLKPREGDQSVWIATWLETKYIVTGKGRDEALANMTELIRRELPQAEEAG